MTRRENQIRIARHLGRTDVVARLEAQSEADYEMCAEWAREAAMQIAPQKGARR